MSQEQSQEQSTQPLSPELVQVLGDLHIRLSNVEEVLVKAQQIQAKPSEDERRKRTQEYIERDEKSNETYAQIILAIGYAGMFTLWVQLKDSIPAWYYFFTGLLALISVSTFVIYEIIKVGLASYANTKWAEDADLDAWWRQRMKYDEIGRKLWKYFYFPCFATGTAAAALLGMRLLWNCLKAALIFV